MRNFQCRNCGSRDRYEKEIAARYGLNLLPIKNAFFENVKLRIEVCGACGLMEWFVPDRYLKRVKESFPKIAE